MLSMLKGMETTNSTWSQRQQGQATEGEDMNREKLQADNSIWVMLKQILHPNRMQSAQV